ncbi:hypothetical protein HAX54_018992 [Datura stramonium]|uniref:EF-hand domain-containing protein n=1 Tax=Datura stramonium TaxID=4076 RepID=A0ABS8UND5_DATST|nr:hypothetical protein [Datura stramonium]
MIFDVSHPVDALYYKRVTTALPFNFRKTFSCLDSSYHIIVTAHLLLSLSVQVALGSENKMISSHPFSLKLKDEVKGEKNLIILCAWNFETFKKTRIGETFLDHGTPNREVLEKLFHAIDENGDERLSHAELRALVVGIRLEEINLEENDAIAKVLKDFDTSCDDQVDLTEFIAGVEKWLYEVRSSNGSSNVAGPNTIKYLDDFHEETRREHSLLGEDQSDEIVEGVENPRKTAIKAALLLLLANSSEAVSAIIFATRKKESASLTFSELYGAVTMNNLLCLSVFLAVCARIDMELLIYKCSSF